jgi:Trk K+ transport system NAD-binding subunit
MLGGDVALREEGENAFMELCLQPGDSAIGKPLQSLDLPETINVVSVERAGVIIIPRGSTIFAVGDIVTVFGHKDGLNTVREVFTSPSPLDDRENAH